MALAFRLWIADQRAGGLNPVSAGLPLLGLQARQLTLCPELVEKGEGLKGIKE